MQVDDALDAQLHYKQCNGQLGDRRGEASRPSRGSLVVAEQQAQHNRRCAIKAKKSTAR